MDPDAGEGCLLVRRLTSVLPWFQQGGESDGFFHLEGQPQRLPQPPEVRQQPARKVTLTKGALQQPQHPPVGAHVHSAGPPGIKSIQGIHPAKKVLPVTAPPQERSPVSPLMGVPGAAGVLRLWMNDHSFLRPGFES